MFKILIVAAAIATAIFTALQYYSSATPSVHAIVYGYPHYHLFDLERTDWSQRDILQNFSVFDDYSVIFVKGVYHISLQNKGNTTAKNVTIYVNGARGMMVSRNDLANYLKGEEVIVGDIRPNEEIEVVSWTSLYLKLRAFSKPDNIRINFDNGTVDIDQRYEIAGITRLLHRTFREYYLLIFIITVIISSIFLGFSHRV